MKVLHVVASLAPSQGGLRTSVLGLARAQAALGATCTVLAGQHPDFSENPDIDRIRFVQLPLLSARYSLPTLRFGRTMMTEVANHDLTHLHGLWNGVVTVAAWGCRRQGRPFIVTPHGMLDRANVRQKLAWKTIYYAVLDRPNLKSAGGWQFLDQSEQE